MYRRSTSWWAAVVAAATLIGCAGDPAHRAVDAKNAQAAAVSPRLNDEFQRALALLRGERYDDAIGLLQRIIEKETRFAAPYVNLGIAYARSGRSEEAESQLVKALEIEPRNEQANNELGVLYRKDGRFSDARKAYETALAGDPQYLPARRNLGILCEIYLHDLKCAREQFEQYQKIAPQDEQVSLWVADLKQRTGR